MTSAYLNRPLRTLEQAKQEISAMSKAQHTPGPWHQTPEAADAIRAQDGSILAQMYYVSFDDGIPPEEVEANARLIAAAPDLLAEGEANAAFLELLAKHLEACGMPGQWNCMIRVHATRRAIAKARGE